MSVKLLKRPVFRTGESRGSYLLRLADANWLHGCRGLASVFHLEPYALMDMPGDRLVELLFESDLQRPDRTTLAASLPVTSSGVHRKGRLCPLCVCEEPDRAKRHGLQLWDEPFNFSCERHGVLLVDNCSACGRSLDYMNRAGLTRCACGTCLDAVKPVPTDNWMDGLRRVFDGTDAAAGDYSRERARRAANAVMRLAGRREHGSHVAPMDVSETSDFVTSEAVTAARPWFIDWPRGFEEQLAWKGWRSAAARDSSRSYLAADQFFKIDAALSGEMPNGSSSTSKPKAIVRIDQEMLIRYPSIFGQAPLPMRNDERFKVWEVDNPSASARFVAGLDSDDIAARAAVGDVRSDRQSLALSDEPFVPFGSISRLLLCWLATRAPEVETSAFDCGKDLRDFMSSIGVDVNSGGERSQLRRVRDQCINLLGIQASIHRKGGIPEGRLVNTCGTLGLRTDDHLTHLGLRMSVRLCDWFVAESKHNFLLLNKDCLRALKGSTHALDVYIWLVWQASLSEGQVSRSWNDVSAYLPSVTLRPRRAKEMMMTSVKRILQICPGLRAEMTRTGITFGVSQQFKNFAC